MPTFSFAWLTDLAPAVVSLPQPWPTSDREGIPPKNLHGIESLNIVQQCFSYIPMNWESKSYADDLFYSWCSSFDCRTLSVKPVRDPGEDSSHNRIPNPSEESL
jgi:hypothetical protein